MEKIKVNSLILSCLIVGTLVNGCTKSSDEITLNPASDATISAQITNQYKQNKLLSASDIYVSTHEGIVHLSGKVDTRMQYRQAITVAKSSPNVIDVDAKHLVITDSHAAIKDSYITTKIQSLLLKHKLFGEKEVAFWPIKVETKEGIVYLTGEVDNATQRNNILAIAKSVKGVKGIKQSLKVKDS